MEKKPFKTYRQQLRILRSRKLFVGNTTKTMRYLEEENYYNIVNGYKSPFLKKSSDGKVIHPEQFRDGASLDELHNLYLFDRELRMVFLKYFLTFESNLKSRISYRFSESYPERNSYLDFNNFSSDSNKIKEVFDTIKTLSGVISKNASKNGTSIQHYIDIHNEVPLWVLSGYLTMGNINHFYSCLVDSLQNKIAQDFNKQYNREHHKKLSLKASDIEGIVKMINLFRNVCAHEEILYSYSLKRPKRFSGIKKFFNNNFPDNQNLYAIYLVLTIVLRKKDSKKLKRELDKIRHEFKDKFSSIKFKDIELIAGFPEDF